jgi:alkylhydroperoxidase family enzyme
MSRHREGIPKEPYYAAKIRAAIAEDCGPCAQLTVNMALEAGVDPERVRAIVNADLAALPAETREVLRFTELVLAHDPEADAVREAIVDRWGDDALISLALAISSTRIYPMLKYVLGHGRTCHRLTVKDAALVPQRTASGATA